MRMLKTGKQGNNQSHLEEYTASKILQEESQRQSYDFMRFFGSETVKRKEEKVRGNSKITTWEDYQDKNLIKNEKQGNPTDHFLPKQYNYVRNKLLRRKIYKLNTQTTDYRPKPKKIEQAEYKNKPTFSISLLNPKIQQVQVHKSAERIQKLRSKLSSHLRSHYMNHIINSSQGEQIQKSSKQRVHSLSSDPPIQQKQKVNAITKKKIYFLNLEHQARENKPKLVPEGRSKSIQAVNQYKKRRQQSIQKISDQQIRKVERKKLNCKVEQTDVLKLIKESKHKLIKSFEFQKLRQLLNLEKL